MEKYPIRIVEATSTSLVLIAPAMDQIGALLTVLDEHCARNSPVPREGFDSEGHLAAVTGTQVDDAPRRFVPTS